MGSGASMGERIWRGIALALFVILVWQAGNAAIRPPTPPAAAYDMANVRPTIAPRFPRGGAPVIVDEETPSPTAAPPATPEPPPLRVANTGGIGVYVRASPRMADRLRAWPDGTIVLPTGSETEAEGRWWREVRDPAGTVGWIPAAYLAP